MIKPVGNEEREIFEGRLFRPGSPELKALKLRSHELSMRYSKLSESQVEERRALLEEIVGELGEGVFIQGPVFFHYGRHTHIGKRTFINYNLTIQDDMTVTIGDDCNLGSNVTIVTPIHPLLPDERRFMRDREGGEAHVCYAKPVVIGNDCWLGANVVVCPGVTIGDGCVIGAGSVVTRDIPPMSLAVGVPCHVVREITAQDSMALRPEMLGNYSVL